MIVFGKGFGQPLSAYTNFQHQFMVWDNGMIRKIESLDPIKVSIGRIAVPYIDNSHNFKIYYKGGVTKINDGFTNNFQVSDYLMTYQNARALFVWQEGKITNLSKYCTSFYLGDSLVIYFDGVQKEYRAYYNEHVYPIEGFLAANSSENIFNTGGTDIHVSNEMEVATGQLPSVKVSDNIAAYVNYSNQFRIFFHGIILSQENYLISSFDVGRNTVAYVDANNQFKVFHNGKTILVDEFAPESYAAGDDLVAFVSNDNSFNIFYRDSVYNLGYFKSDYIVKDNVVAFEDGSGYFKVFYKGNIFTLDNYYPDDIVAGYNSVAYVNRANELKLFTDGNIYEVTNASIAEWGLHYDVIQYRFGANMYKIFYKGRTY